MGKVVRDHDTIAVEDFRPKFLAKSTMARKAADAAISATKAELINMARKHDRDLRLVRPAHAAVDCAHCGASQARAATVGTHLHLHRVRNLIPQDQLRPRDAQSGLVSTRLVLIVKDLTPRRGGRQRELRIPLAWGRS